MAVLVSLAVPHEARADKGFSAMIWPTVGGDETGTEIISHRAGAICLLLG